MPGERRLPPPPSPPLQLESLPAALTNCRSSAQCSELRRWPCQTCADLDQGAATSHEPGGGEAPPAAHQPSPDAIYTTPTALRHVTVDGFVSGKYMVFQESSPFLSTAVPAAGALPMTVRCLKTRDFPRQPQSFL
eukprot:gene9804-biopygen1714